MKEIYFITMINELKQGDEIYITQNYNHNKLNDITEKEKVKVIRFNEDGLYAQDLNGKLRRFYLPFRWEKC